MIDHTETIDHASFPCYFIVKDAGIEVKYGSASEKDVPKSDLKIKIILYKSEFEATKSYPENQPIVYFRMSH